MTVPKVEALFFFYNRQFAAMFLAVKKRLLVLLAQKTTKKKHAQTLQKEEKHREHVGQKTSIHLCPAFFPDWKT